MDKEINGIVFLDFNDDMQQRFKSLNDKLQNPINQEELYQLVDLVYKEAFRDGYSFAQWLAGEYRVML